MKKSILLILLIFSISAEEKEEITNKAEIMLKDKSFIIGNISIKEIPIKTNYGELNLKVSSITKIEFGLKPSLESKTKLRKLLADLKNSNPEIATSAENQIIDLGAEVLPLLRIESEKKTSEQEKIYDIISNIESNISPEQNISEFDRIYLNDESIINGVLGQDSIFLKTKFGTIKLNKELISTLTISKEETEKTQILRKEFKIAANKYIPVNTAPNSSYLNTKIYLKKGEKFSIKASGEIILASLSSKTFTPMGDSVSGNWMNIPFGALAGRIGLNSNPFLIGTKYSGIAQESGFLFLTISETVYNAGNTGEYKVIITK